MNKTQNEHGQEKETIAQRAIELAQTGLNYSYGKVANSGFRIFGALGLSYILTNEVLTKTILHEQFLIASWFNIIIFYLIIIFIAVLIYIVFDVVKDLLIYIFR